MDQKYKRKGKHSAFVNLTMSTNIISSSTEKLNLTMEQINELLRSLTNKSSLFNQTIEHNFNIYDLINFSLEGILLPLLCLIGMTGRLFFLHSLSLVTEGNLMSAYVLLTRELYLKRSYHQLSLSQLTWNSLHLLSSTLLHSMRHLTPGLWRLLMPLVYPVAKFSLMASIYTMIALTAHRYCAVCVHSLPCRYH